MANVKKIEDGELMTLLSGVFKDFGYEGTSLSVISDVTGLKKPSFYHRFPGGKEQMAEEVLNHTYNWLEEEILLPMAGNLSPEEKIALFTKKVGELYKNGKESCLLNMFSAVKSEDNPFQGSIRKTVLVLKKVLSDAALESGFSKDESDIRAEQILVELQGALVLSRALGSMAPFKRMQERLPSLLLQN